MTSKRYSPENNFLARQIKEQTTDTATSFFWFFIDPLLGQKGRGGLMSLVATGISFFISLIIQNAFGVDDTSLFVFIDLVMSNFLGFALDILVGSREGWCSNALVTATGLNKNCDPRFVFKQSSGVSGALGVLVEQIASESFWAFWVTVVFDILVSVQLFDGMKNYILENTTEGITSFAGIKTQIFANPTMRRLILKTFISFTTFVIYANLFRFDWAYKERGNPVRLADMFVLGLTLVAATDYFFTIPADSDSIPLREEKFSLFRTEQGKKGLVVTSFACVAAYVFLVYFIIKPLGFPKFLTTPRVKAWWALLISLIFILVPIYSAIKFTEEVNRQEEERK